MASRVKKYPVKEQKGPDKERKEERHMVKKNAAARKKIEEAEEAKIASGGFNEK